MSEVANKVHSRRQWPVHKLFAVHANYPKQQLLSIDGVISISLKCCFMFSLHVTINNCCRFEEFAATGPNICPLDIELKWMTEVSSSVYATPLITDLYADGRKDIIVPGAQAANACGMHASACLVSFSA